MTKQKKLQKPPINSIVYEIISRIYNDRKNKKRTKRLF